MVIELYLLGQWSQSHGVGVVVIFRSVEAESWGFSRGYFRSVESGLVLGQWSLSYGVGVTFR